MEQANKSGVKYTAIGQTTDSALHPLASSSPASDSTVTEIIEIDPSETRKSIKKLLEKYGEQQTSVEDAQHELLFKALKGLALLVIVSDAVLLVLITGMYLLFFIALFTDALSEDKKNLFLTFMF